MQFDEEAIAELANSIAQRGVLQPILLRPDGDGFQIVAGERRWRAAQKARLHAIPAIVREIDDSARRRDRADREHPARGSQRARGGGRLPAADRALRPHPGRRRPARPQVAQPRRQPAAAARPAGGRAPIAVARRYQYGPRAGRGDVGRSRSAGPRRSSPRACRSARPKRWPRRFGRAPAPTWAAPSPGLPRRSTPTSPRSSASSATSSASRSRSPTTAPRGRSSLHYSSLDQLDMICQRLSGEPI